ncbi:MAG: hypothetical protein DRQ89_11685 [Epsilonproteobacteria bacterium]|nr:MAG: hypothetical protein DRQ89_11685 [Campylobacterota bacterium]
MQLGKPEQLEDNVLESVGVNFIDPDEDILPDGSEVTEDVTEDVGDAVAGYVMNMFGFFRDSRRNSQENIMLQCERAYGSKYAMDEQTELARRNKESGDSTAFIPLTRTKVNIAIAKTYEKIVANSETWSLSPDEITQDEKAKNSIDVMMGQMSGRLQISPAEALEKMNEFTQQEKSKQCESMEDEISEQMNKGDAFVAIAKTLLHQHYLGTGVAKFETTVFKNEVWKKDEFNKWELTFEDKPFPRIKFCSLFDVFFDPFARYTDKDTNVIERHVVKLSELNGYKNSKGFLKDVIDEIILANPEGNHIDQDYETTIRGINDQDQNVTSSDGYFDLYEAWVEISGSKLIENNFTDNIEPTESYKVNCWVCANKTIKLMLNPHKPQKSPYFIIPYQESTQTIYGTGIAEELFCPQDVINSVTRATISNAAFSHAPIIEVNVDMLKSGESPVEVLKPRQIFLREGGDPKEPMVRFYQPTENSAVLMNVMGVMNKIAEEVTGIGSTTEESLPSANAANMGISMILSQKNIMQRTVISNIDKYLIKPMIEMYYDFNMQWNDKDEIKCPAKVTANGISGIIAREMRTQQIVAFSNLTANPQDASLVNRRKVLTMLVESMDKEEEEVLYTKDEEKQNRASSAEQQRKAVEAEQQGIIAQIQTAGQSSIQKQQLANAGDINQERIKSETALRKQKLIEQSKMQQQAASGMIEVTEQEYQILENFRRLRNEQSYAR